MLEKMMKLLTFQRRHSVGGVKTQMAVARRRPLQSHIVHCCVKCRCECECECENNRNQKQ